ncbi:DNA-binding response regulator [Pseudomonas fluorescens]|uniref:Response regulator transcription factor n=1 Tax=Pseudomonas fluorescens TaxID=294 RepID=A0A1B3DHQ8_PSEFL|nr:MULTISPECIES: response regulator transcription factor [Pseudomonas]AOE71034.1 DNA-binding response regulator [Pseudomonas fluorescens]AOE76815.1 DNA-binding response regulator [Pseudomonas fluorescens]PMX15618.1 DNA-binding response regulator [Pseudomonas sp. MPBC4-3]PMX18285.1 DNA-binding response regulator [Pseudomonas sp. GW460-12]PMX30500.1 DNA-binding response regulator [Pseudomonas sp. MPR-R2A4]
MPTSSSNPYTVVLLDDHEMVRQGIELGLRKEADLSVIGSFGTGKQLLEALTLRPADVVVMDFILAPSEIDGLSLIQTLNRRFRQCRPLIVCSHYTPATVSMSLKAGCWGVLGKTQNMSELVTAIRTVAQGRIYLHPCMMPALQGMQSLIDVAHKPSNMEFSTSSWLNACLTPKEQEVLRCFLDGMSVNSIAAKFSRSVSTISTQKQSAYRKLGIKSDSELFRFTQQFGEFG